MYIRSCGGGREREATREDGEEGEKEQGSCEEGRGDESIRA